MFYWLHDFIFHSTRKFQSSVLVQKKQRELVLYDNGEDALVTVTKMFLGINRDSSGDAFTWKVEWEYSVDSEQITISEFLSKAPGLDVGSQFWVLYDKNNKTLSLPYEGFEKDV